MKQGALIFDELTDRYDIRFDLADYYGGLHCGDCLEVFTGGKWKAWQRQLTDNAYYSANYIKAIQPLTGEKPTDLQRAHIQRQKAASQEKPAPEPIYKVHANPGSDSRDNLYVLQAYFPQEDGKAKIGDVLYIGTPEKCRELMAQLNAGELTQGEVKELYAQAQTAEQDKDTFSIYQLKRGDETRVFETWILQ